MVEAPASQGEHASSSQLHVLLEGRVAGKMREPMRSPCARLVLLMHSLERADNWRTIIGNYTRQRSVCSILIIWNNFNITMPEVLRSALGGKTRVLAARQNSLTNRYTTLPSGTDPVLFADDDLISSEQSHDVRLAN